jgi:hypothetical protein
VQRLQSGTPSGSDSRIPSPEELGQIWSQFLGNLNSEDGQTSWIAWLRTQIRALVDRFPLLKPSFELAKLLAAEPSRDSETSVKLLIAFAKCGMHPLFHSKLMHPGVTASDLRDLIEPVIDLAQRLSSVRGACSVLPSLHRSAC